MPFLGWFFAVWDCSGGAGAMCPVGCRECRSQALKSVPSSAHDFQSRFGVGNRDFAAPQRSRRSCGIWGLLHCSPRLPEGGEHLEGAASPGSSPRFVSFESPKIQAKASVTAWVTPGRGRAVLEVTPAEDWAWKHLQDPHSSPQTPAQSSSLLQSLAGSATGCQELQ